MIALPLDLEQQVIQFAQIEHLDPVSFLKRVIADYRSTHNEDTLYLVSTKQKEPKSHDIFPEAFITVA